MAHRDDYRDYRSGDPRDRWRGQDAPRGRLAGPERRTFGQEGRFNSDTARYGGERDTGEREPWRRERHDDGQAYGAPPDEDWGYGGQEYGVEAPHYSAAFPNQPRPDGRFEPEYLSWRDAQLRAHDRDYEAWRADRQRRYDDDYRAWRSQRREQFHQSFAEWCAQRDAAPQETPATEVEAPPRPDAAETS